MKHRVAIDAILAQVGIGWTAIYEAAPKSVKKKFWREVYDVLRK